MGRLLPVAATAIFLVAAIYLLAEDLEDTFYIPPDHAAIQYNTQPPNDPVARLNKRLLSGQVKLATAPNGLGYLPSVLKELGINVDSQTLVFSKTSTQSERISPGTPRALYFNDDVSVGFVRNSDLLEFAAVDPKQGVNFYVLATAKQPEFSRNDGCLRCHQGAITLGIPGLLVSSVRPASNAPHEMHGNSFVTDDRSPFNTRWGGWYVTGTHGSMVHQGNNPNLTDAVHPGPAMTTGTQNITSLADRFDTTKYPTGTSDIVALMTLEHQTRMTNLMIRMNWDARIAAQEHKLDAAGRDRLNSEIEEMLGYMLFTDEAPLKAPVKGVSTFTQTFEARGPRDKQGRSLRDYDLTTRMFRYPLSYMIYSAAFDAMPDIVKERVYQRLFDVLTSKDKSEKFSKLSAPNRQAILEIVRDTKKGLPSYWIATK